MGAQAEISSQNTISRNMRVGIHERRSSVHGRGIPKAAGTMGILLDETPTVLSEVGSPGLAPMEAPDDCCGLGSKFCVGGAGSSQMAIERHALFDELTPPRVQKIFRTVYRLTKNREDADDAIQDAFLRALVRLQDFDGRSAFATWFTRIAINCSLMMLRKRKKARTVSLDGAKECEESNAFQQATDPAPDAEKRYLQRERTTALRDAINELRPSLRVAVELRHLAERSIQETAETLAVSLGATKSRLFHARAALRKSPKLRTFRNTALKAKLELSDNLEMEAPVQWRHVKHG